MGKEFIDTKKFGNRRFVGKGSVDDWRNKLSEQEKLIFEIQFKEIFKVLNY